jgi:hypothetical protein
MASPEFRWSTTDRALNHYVQSFQGVMTADISGDFEQAPGQRTFISAEFGSGTYGMEAVASPVCPLWQACAGHK